MSERIASLDELARINKRGITADYNRLIADRFFTDHEGEQLTWIGEEVLRHEYAAGVLCAPHIRTMWTELGDEKVLFFLDMSDADWDSLDYAVSAA